jgi:hypothetical protein
VAGKHSIAARRSATNMDGMDKEILKCGDDFFSGLPRRFAVRNDGSDFAIPLRHSERSEAIQKNKLAMTGLEKENGRQKSPVEKKRKKNLEDNKKNYVPLHRFQVATRKFPVIT